MDFGSGSQTLGNTDPIAQAMARRSTGDAGATSQVSPASANFDPTTQAPIQNVPQAPTMSQGALPQQDPMTQQQPATASMPFDPAEVKIILQAMGGRMKSLSRLQGDIKA